MAVLSTRLVSAALVLAFVAAPAHSADLIKAQKGLDQLKELNLFSFGNVKMAQEVEGKSFIGGDLSGNGGQFGNGSNQGYINPASDALVTATIVGGSSATNVQLNAGNIPGGTVGPRGITIGGTLTGNLNINATGATTKIRALSNANVNGSSGGTIAYGSKSGGNLNANGSTVIANDPTLNAAFSAALVTQRNTLNDNYKELSAVLAGFTSDSSINAGDPNNVVFNATPGVDKVAVFSITNAVAFFNNANGFSFNLGSATAAIINVNDTNPVATLNLADNFLGNPLLVSQKLIWNFGPNIQGINFGTGFYGSVLALHSSISNGNSITGGIAVKSFDRANIGMNGEVHLGTFGGQLALVPEPASWAMMIAGFGLAGAVARRRRVLSPA